VSIEIVPIPCLRDNYAYAIVDESDAVWVVDPSEATPILSFLSQRRARLSGVLLTHHHHDHVGGVPDLVKDAPWLAEVRVVAHERDRSRIAGLTHTMAAPLDSFALSPYACGGLSFEAMSIPGHTHGAVAWRLGNDVFVGDTLFSAGCGRLFEGSAAEMYASLLRLGSLAPSTRLWFGHEYTSGILEWTVRHFPEEEACQSTLAELIAQQERGLSLCTTPTTVAKEWAINVFLRARDESHFAELRLLKDKG
jgi:hydroxyacylglutathione hydrolase